MTEEHDKDGNRPPNVGQIERIVNGREESEMATKKKPQVPIDHIVSDPKTGLEWSITLGDRVNWKTAKKVAEAYRGGGHDDWRLPTIEELITLIDFSRFNPAANTDLFPDMKSSWYWSGTPASSSPGGYAWVVNLDNGCANYYNQSGTVFVRAVRGSRRASARPRS